MLLTPAAFDARESFLSLKNFASIVLIGPIIDEKTKKKSQDSIPVQAVLSVRQNSWPGSQNPSYFSWKDLGLGPGGGSFHFVSFLQYILVLQNFSYVHSLARDICLVIKAK